MEIHTLGNYRDKLTETIVSKLLLDNVKEADSALFIPVNAKSIDVTFQCVPQLEMYDFTNIRTVVLLGDFSIYDDPMVTSEEIPIDPAHSFSNNKILFVESLVKLLLKDKKEEDTSYTIFRFSEVLGETKETTISETFDRWITEAKEDGLITTHSTAGIHRQHIPFEEAYNQVVKSLKSARYNNQTYNIGGDPIQEMSLAKLFVEAYLHITGEKIGISFSSSAPLSIIGDNWYASNVLDFRGEVDYQRILEKLIQDYENRF